jgi:UDP-N-acetylglucosamine 3-dehydrogenase
MATSVKEANEMIQAAKENGVHLMIGHNQRLIPAHVKAKQILKQGYLGKVISFRTTFAHGGPERWSVEGKNGWFFQKAKAFVGAMGDLGVHKADLIRWLLDDEVVQVAAFVETLHKEGTDVDDNATCLLRMKCGAIGTLTASWTHYGSEDNSTILSCENGTLKIGADPQYPVAVDLLTGETERYTVGAISTNTNQLSSGVIDAFIQCILSGTSPSISGEEGLKSLNVILACLESAEKNAFVSL